MIHQDDVYRWLMFDLGNRGPIILTIDEAEYLLDQLPAPSSDEDQLVTKLRKRLQGLLTELRSGAEGVVSN
ncbi:hypothetical protein C8Q74DRAFT_1368232 [Fomes fomentarius]|nr:hypothetical protein C8Q74DRAFT_1368232 [Fomes fomentarius]